MPKFTRDTRLRRPLLWLFLAILLLKLALLAIDPQVRFFFGDSESYLVSAETGWIPPIALFAHRRGRPNGAQSALPAAPAP